jgi:hypothetical protein
LNVVSLSAPKQYGCAEHREERDDDRRALEPMHHRPCRERRGRRRRGHGRTSAGDYRLAGGEARVEIAANPPQLRLKIGGVLISQVAFFLERGCDDHFETGRNQRIQVRDRTRCAIENRIVDNGRRAATERLAARDHLVEHRAKGEEIGS